ncbi:MAG: serine/threonine protein kinase, partial [Acidobacteria bacterium]|nr:serine/threonine protein kinase [Acidobacteriota bacterium]
MERGASGDERYMTLLATTLDLDGPDERRAFLEVVCQDEPELLADIMKTITVDQKKDDAQTSRAAGESHSLFEAGQVVAGRFHIVRELGEGGMAVVYEAVDSKLIERRALKFSKAGYSQSIPPEARSALRVTHENICRVYEIHATATESGPADFLSMEFLDGETLLNRWQREAIPGSLAIDIARQICRGLEAAHSAGILHRDLKSNNVMLVKRADGSLRAVITDFGLARPLSHRTGPASSAVSGTPNYIAPERWKGGTATPASDVYALGVILYEMLAGSLPFAHGTPWQKRLSGLPEPPSRSERAPDARWDGIVLGCLDPDPRKRFSSAHQVLEAIEQAFH